MKKSAFIKIGLIVSISLFALFWGINFLKGKGTFNTDNKFYVIYDRIDGLYESNPVLINGYAVGKVSTISILPDTSGRLLVELSLKNEFSIPGGTVARIFSSDLMGTKAIGLQYGKESYLHQSGDTLIADFEGSLQELVSLQMLPLKTKAEDLMKQMEQAIEIVNYVFNEETRDDIMASFKNIKKTFANLESSSSNLDSIVFQSKGKLENILSNVESITNNLENNNQLITHTLTNLSNISDSIAGADLQQTLIETYGVMVELNDITRKINNSEGTIGMLVNNDTLYHNLEDVSYSLNRLLEDMRLNPKRYVHFSAFNLGKTVYVDQPQTSNKKKKENIIYKVLIHQSNKSVPLNPQNFKGYKNVEEAMMGGSFIYLIGKEKNIESAKLYIKKVRFDFPEAQLVEIRQGKYTILINN